MRARAHELRALYGLAGCYVERALAWQDHDCWFENGRALQQSKRELYQSKSALATRRWRRATAFPRMRSGSADLGGLQA